MSVIKIEFDTNDEFVTGAVTAMLNNLNENRHDVKAPTQQALTSTQQAPTQQAPTPTPTPTQQAPTPTQQAPTGELDAAGLPYDERIHSRTGSKNADGSWKLKRKPKEFETTEAWEQYVAACRAEHAGTAPQAEPAPTIPAPVSDVEPTPAQAPAIPAPVSDVEPTPTAETVAPNAPSVFAAPTPPPVEADENITFGSLMTFITSNGLQMPDVLALDVMKNNNIVAIPLLAQRPELFGEVMAALKAKVA